MNARAAYQRRLRWRINAYLRRLAEGGAAARTAEELTRSDTPENE